MNEDVVKEAQNFNIISEWATSDVLINTKIFKPGDMVEVHRGLKTPKLGYRHWVLIVQYIKPNNDYEIIHFTGEPKAKDGAKILRGWLREAADSSEIRLNNGRDKKEEEIGLPLDSTEKIIRRAEEKVNGRSWGNLYDKYNVFINNCEHFVTFCRYGVPYMGQSKLAFDAINILKSPSNETERWLRNFNINYSKSSKQVAKDMVEQNTVPWLIKLLKSSRNDICDYMLKILTTIAQHKIFNDQLIFHGLIEHFKTYSENFLCYENIGNLLIWLCIMEQIAETHVQDVIDSGIFKWIITFIEKSFFFDFNILQHSASIICNISNGTKDHVMAIVNALDKENGSRLIALLEFSNDNISIALLKAFTNIVKHQELSDSIIKHGMLKHVAKFLNSSNKDLHTVAIDFVRSLTFNNENGVIVVVENKLLPLIVQILNNDAIEIREIARLTLKNIATTSVERKQMICKAVCGDHNVPELIGKIKNGKLTKNDVFKLANIAYYQNNNKEIFESGIINQMKEFLKDSSGQDVQHQAIRLISYITSNSEAQNEIVNNEDILKIIIHLFDSENSKILQYLAKTFENIANENEKNSKIIVEWNVVPKLEKLLYFKDDNASDNAEFALKKIISHGTIFKEVVKVGEINFDDTEIGQTLNILENLATTRMYSNTFDDNKILSQVEKCLQSSDVNVEIQTLRLLINISALSLDKFQFVKNKKFLDLIISLTGCDDTLIGEMALSILINIAAGKKEQIQAIVDADVIPKLINLLETHKENISEKSVKVVANIACKTQSYCILIKSNIFFHLKNILKYSNSEIQRGFRCFIDNMMNNTDINGLIEFDLVPAIINLFDLNEVIITKYALSTLNEIIKKSLENATIVISCDLIPKLQNLLCSPDLHEHKVVLNILNTVARYQIFNEELFHCNFLQTMENFLKEGSEMSTQYSACMFIYNLATDLTHIKYIIARDNIIQYIVDLFKFEISRIVNTFEISAIQETKTSYLLYAGALVLAQIVKGTKEEIQVIINSGAIQELKWALFFNTKINIEIIVFNCFASICQYKEFIGEILDSHLLQFMKIKLSKQNLNENSTLHAICLIHKFSTGSTEQKQIILDSNIISILIDFIYVIDEKICVTTLYTLSNLFNGTKTQAESLVRTNIISKLIPLLISDKDYICEAVIFTLANIAQHLIFNIDLINAGILSFIESFLRKKNEGIVMQIVRLIWHMPVVFKNHYVNYSSIFSSLKKLLDDDVDENVVEILLSIDRTLILFNHNDPVRQSIIQKLAENDVTDKIKNLSSNKNYQIHDLSTAILEKCDLA